MSDLIDRQAAIEAIASRDETNGTVKVFTGREVNGILADLPPAQPERKTGQWIKKGSYKDRWGDTVEILRCPICEFKHNYSCGDTSKHDDGWFNFCPNCGSPMEVEHERLH